MSRFEGTTRPHAARDLRRCETRPEEREEEVVAHVGLTAQTRKRGGHPHGQVLWDRTLLLVRCGLDWKFDAICLHVVTAWRMLFVRET